MSKHFTPPARKAPLKPSRIRRQPVKLVPDAPAAAVRKPVRLSDTEQMWFGVTGVLIFAAALVVLTVAAAIFTFTRDDPDAAARAARFAQCYNASGPNCVLDGDTMYVAGKKVEIAGITAPQIQGAQCDAERDKGIDAAVQLESLLNSGKVTVSPPSRDFYGRVAQTVQVNGADVGQMLMNSGAVRQYDGTNRSWCASAANG